MKVKICGITNLADAQVAVEGGADMLGFIFHEPSPRYIPPASVRQIITALRPADVLYVGVFVNLPLEIVRQTLEFCRLDMAQLHGDEPPDFVRQLNDRAYKALRPQSLSEAQQLTGQYRPPGNRPTDRLPYFLLDAYHPQLYGGTGQVTDWTMAAEIARQYPTMLAGSLTPDNVTEAVRRVQPWGVDVSSGVEARKGYKDHQKVRDFIKQAKRSI